MATAEKRYKIETATSPRTKANLIKTISENTDLSRAQVTNVLDTMGAVIQKDLGRSGPGAVNLAGYMKITVQRKPATKERAGINPFTGEPTTFKAKPARNVVKVRPLKTLKGMV